MSAKRKPTRQLLRERVRNELRFSLTVEAPDDEGGGTHRIDVDLKAMSLGERELARAAMAKAVQPAAWEVVVIVHAWVVWRRSHPTSSLQTWMDDITLSDILDGINVEPSRTVWDTTPEGFDPEA